MIRRLLIGAVVVGVAGATLAAWRTTGVRVDVRPGMDPRAVLDRVPAGSTLRLLPGRHRAITVDRPIVIEAEDGAVVPGPVLIGADGVALRGLRIEGGASGVVVREADDVTLTGVRVTGAEDHGIEVVDASVRIDGCRVESLVGAMPQGIEIRNANGRPRSVISGCTIRGGMEGIVSHVSRLEVLDNRVVGTDMRGISITEMSEGLAAGNLVEEASGAGIYCGDMSHCEIRGNTIRQISGDGSGITSRSGYGIVGLYQATIRATENRMVGVRRETGLLVGSVATDRFPLSIWPPGWRGALPGIGVAALALATLAGARVAVTPWVRRRRPAASVDAGRALPILIAGFAVQTFHMLEHLVQVYQVYVADAEVRSGLAGQRVDTEWVHFLYNLAVLGFLAWAWRVLREDDAPAREGTSGFLLAALAVQAYHMAEHTAKLVQHLATGVDPAPGILGGAAGLVWFHFGINLSVYVGMAIPLVAVINRALRARPSRPRAAPALAPVAQPEPPISS